MASLLKRPAPWIFIVGLILGLVVFFPLHQIQNVVSSELYTQARLDLRMRSLRLGTGLVLGLGRGGLLAFKADKVEVAIAGGPRVLTCEQMLLTPQMWALFTGQARIGFQCLSDASAKIEGLAKINLWESSPTLSLEVDLQNLPLRSLSLLLPIAIQRGEASGKLTVLDLKLRGNTTPTVTWDLRGENVSTEPKPTEFFLVPGLDLGPVNTQGRLERNRLGISKLEFGTPQTPLQGTFQVELTLNGQGPPQSGKIKGRLRTLADFEKEQLKDLGSLDTLLGTKDEQGYRSISKAFNDGNVLSLLQ